MADLFGCDGDALVNAIKQMISSACVQGGWDEVEPVLASAWERLRTPKCPQWSDVAAQVRKYFELMTSAR
jgi:hypothetical protein